MEIQRALAVIVDGTNLTHAEMAEVMRQVMSGDASDAQIGALLMGLRMKGETIEEIAGAAEVMRDLATPVDVDYDDLVDIVGTGGDGANLFNVSTAATFVVAAAGAHVAKHGNRSVSSTSGSSDVLEALGVPLNLDSEQVARAIEEVGMGFMFAPSHHSAMRYAIGPRREMAMRTLFNLLGPLTNPAKVQRQLLGVYSADLCQPMAEALRALGSRHALVVHSADGLDEFSIAAPTHVAELKDGAVQSYDFSLEDIGRSPSSLEGLAVDSADASAKLIRAALSGGTTEAEKRAAEMIMLNAGAAIYVAGVAGSLKDGVDLAEDLIATGQAAEKLKEFVNFTQLLRDEARFDG